MATWVPGQEPLQALIGQLARARDRRDRAGGVDTPNPVGTAVGDQQTAVRRDGQTGRAVAGPRRVAGPPSPRRLMALGADDGRDRRRPGRSAGRSRSSAKPLAGSVTHSPTSTLPSGATARSRGVDLRLRRRTAIARVPSRPGPGERADPPGGVDGAHAAALADHEAAACAARPRSRTDRSRPAPAGTAVTQRARLPGAGDGEQAPARPRGRCRRARTTTRLYLGESSESVAEHSAWMSKYTV